MFAWNRRTKLLFALALVVSLVMLAVSASTIRTPRPQSEAAAAPEIAPETTPPNPHKAVGGKKAGRGSHLVQHAAKPQPTPTPATQSSTGSSSTDSDQGDINLISLIGTIVGIVGTILSVLIAWLTYQQGRRTQRA